MMRLRPRGIARTAVPQEVDGRIDFLVGDRVVARVYYHPTGAVEWEVHFDEQGRMHGLEREEHEDGTLKYRARYRHGLQEGWQEQWTRSGRLVVRKRFVAGTGVDLWWASGLSEERHFVDGLRHGPERQWISRRRGLWKETWFVGGLEHGIEREWNEAGRLRRGFPRYYVAGRRVTRREHEAARRSDPSLAPRCARDDRPRRPYPRLVDEPPTGSAS